ncbi:MAG: ABC transporter ATP-binding protein [Propionibacteriaceae bacterium]|nr:ABC transporter ATP-binding protein [Propionibacteriaceae bacterium]
MGISDSDPLALRVAARSDRKSFGRLVTLVRTSLSLVWSSGRGLLLWMIGLNLLGALALALQVVAIQVTLEAILRSPDAGAGPVLAPVLGLAAITAVSAVTTTLGGQLQRLLGESVARSMWQRVLAVATGVNLSSFESPDFYNRLSRVQTNAIVRPYQVTQGLFAMAGAGAAGVGVGLALVSISPILLPLIVVGGIPLLITSRRESRLEFEFSVRETPAVRMRGYFTLLQTGRDEAKEVRAFGLGPWLRERFDALYDTYLRDLRSHVRRRAVLSVLGQLGAAVMLGVTLLALVWLIVQGRIGIAGAGAALVAVRMLASQVQILFGGVQTIFESGLFLDDLSTFLAEGTAAEEEESGVEAPQSFGLIRVEDVHFRYPGSETDALRGVDAELHAGELIALVGENGSGKTTLAKLLAGLYRPDKGRITWDGRDVTSFRPSSLRRQISVVFQDFVRYALSGTENISVGRVSEPIDLERVRSAAAAAGAEQDLAALPNGFDTTLSKMFTGGQDLSGGQWQRVAVARSFYRDAPLVILDEPSAALDPRAEHDLFATLRRALHGRTALFISHRFSTVRGADRIYVLEAGEVVEEGSHDDLIALNGRYAELFRLQSAAFVASAEDAPADGL